ncbi:MAG: hypothetical protein ABI315_16260 [Bacteroidia bacterium]
MKKEQFDVAIIYEHPEWHQPLFEALEMQGVSYVKIDLKKGAFHYTDIPSANLYYNLVSPSAYLRGNQKAIPFANALCRNLEYQGATVLNGSESMALEFSKSAQMALLSSMKIDHPKTITFNGIESIEKYSSSLKFPMVLKPEQGGSGARMYIINSLEELRKLLSDKPELWLPDNLLLLQEHLNYNEDFGIVRLEFIGGKLLYAMRVVTHGVFNLCPSVVCNPENGEAGSCELITPSKKPEFYSFPEVPKEAVQIAERIMAASKHGIGSVEYLETIDGRRVFYDINANSNLRESIGRDFGKEPFADLANYLLTYSKPDKAVA